MEDNLEPMVTFSNGFESDWTGITESMNAEFHKLTAEFQEPWASRVVSGLLKGDTETLLSTDTHVIATAMEFSDWYDEEA